MTYSTCPTGVVLRTPGLSRVHGRLRIVGLLAALLLLLLAGGTQPAHAQASATIPPEVLADLERFGVAPVIVQFDLPGLRAADVEAAANAQAPMGVEATSAIAEAQQALLARLAPYGPQHVKLFPFTPGMALSLDSIAGLEALYADPVVAGVMRDAPVPPALTNSIPRIRAQFAHTFGYRGNGQTVAILDTGVDKFHPDLQGKVVSEACFSSAIPFFSTSTCPGGNNSTSNNSGLACTGASGCDHGTHVAAIAAGVAPGANLMAMQVFSRIIDSFTCSMSGQTTPCVMAFPSDYILALNRVYALRNSYNIASVNMSLGGGQFGGNCDFDPTKISVDLLRSAGTLTVIAAGNDGFRNSMGLPACISTAVSVASSTNLDQPSSFTNISSLTTLFAPGSSIVAAVPGTNTAQKSGTSMAAPHVAGALAVWRSASPGASATALRNVLTSTGPTITDNRSNGQFTKRRLDVYAGLCSLVTCDADDFRTLVIGSSLTGTTNPGSDRDHYYLNATAGNRVTLSVVRTSGTMDPYVELFSPNGTRVAFNNDGGVGTNALINNFLLSQSGFYIVVVSSANNQTGGYRVEATTEPANVNPVPSISFLSPSSATGTFLGSDFWVRIDGNNFMPTSQVRWNGSLRAMFYTSPSRIWIRVLGSDLGLPWPRTANITVTNPGPGGGSSAPRPFSITFPILGESKLLEPASGVTVTTDVKTTFVISWTVPITQDPFSWRVMQNMDLRLRDDDGNVAAWIRVTERVTETSTMRLLNAAETNVPISDTTNVTATISPPLEGIPGVDLFDIVISDTVTLHLADSAFSGSGPTAIMSPTVTFGPNAVGRYNIEFRVDGPNGEIQDDDVLGVIDIVPALCPAAVSEMSVSGPSSGETGQGLVYTANLTPVSATQPVTVTWAPEPASGQGTTTATYTFTQAGVQTIFVSAENCGGFAAAVTQTAVSSGSDPDLVLSKRAPASVLAGAPITYTLVVTNRGATTATNIVVADQLPSGATYLSGGTPAGDTVIFDILELPGVGASVEVTFAVTAATPLTNAVYSLTADGGITATGSVAVVTAIADAQTTLGPTITGTLVYTGPNAAVQVAATESVTALNRISATFPAGVVFDDTTVALHVGVPSPAPSPTTTLVVATFDLIGYRNDVALSQGYTLSEQIPLQVVYATGVLSQVQQSTLRLVAWDGAAWREAGIACSHTPNAMRLDCQMDTPALTTYALIGEAASDPDPEPETERLYLPTLQR